MPLETKLRTVIWIRIQICRGDSESDEKQHWENVTYFGAVCTESSWHQDAALSAQWLKFCTNHKDTIVRTGWRVIKSPGSYYPHSETGRGSGHLCPQCVLVQQEQSISVTVRPHGKSPPAQSQSASKTQLIIYTPYLAKLAAGRGFLLEPKEVCREADFRIIILRATLTVFTQSGIMSLRGTWDASSGRDRASKVSHIRQTHTVHRGLMPHHHSPDPAPFVPRNMKLDISRILSM